MNRRDFIKLLFGATALAALPAWARPKPKSEDFTVEFEAYKDPFSNHVSDLRSYVRMPLDIDSIEPINIPFRNDGQWHHYGFTRQNGNLNWYIDGEKQWSNS